jgi:hypothetical protein
MLRKVALPLVAFALLACGGAAKPAAEPGAAGDAPAEEGAEAAAPAESGSIEDQRGPFVKSCMEKSRSKEYCECGFEQFKSVFAGDDLSKPLEPGDPRVAELQKKTASACASKLSEEEVKASFLQGCAEGDERKSAYCNCAWPSLRKKLSHTDFIGVSGDDPRFTEPKKAMVIECKGKFPVEVAKFEFMKGCTQGESAAESSCGCKWDKLKKQFTTEELVAGTVDVAAAKGLTDCK